MGDVFFFPLGQLIQAFQADTFFETGTGFGLGVQSARMFPFKQIVSVEILAAEVERIRPAFSADRRVHLIAGRSIDVMNQLLPQIPGNIIFWLDAHFPGAHHRQAGYQAESDIDTRLPLERELSLIKQLRAGKRDVILIDDLRIYEVDNFEWGNMSDVGQGAVARYDSKFLYTTFADTHVAQRFLNCSGYFALLPKSPPGTPDITLTPPRPLL
jgi:hypothetical protein